MTRPETPTAPVDIPQDELLAAGLVRHLRERGFIWGAPLWAYDTLTSTNDHIKCLAQAGAREWTVVVARQQTRGRGRQGTWVSPPGNLYLSVLLRPAAEVPLTLVPLAAGVAVADTLREWSVSARLKWPNDALAAERKIAGVLAESATSGTHLDYVIVGVGLNLDWDPAGVPELAATATSVYAQTGHAPEIAPAAAALLAHLPAWYQTLVHDPRGLVAAWRERAVPWWGERVQVECGGRTLYGCLRDINADGALLVEEEDEDGRRGGRLHTLLSGDIRRLRPVSPTPAA